MLNPHFRAKIRHYWRSHGFTQLELLIIVFLIGIMATISLPSLGGMLEAARARQAAVEVRSAFQETQRQSIRGNVACTTDIDIPDLTVSLPVIRGNCMSSGEVDFPEGIALATNVLAEAVPTDAETNIETDDTGFKPWEQKVYRANILRTAYCFLFPNRCRYKVPPGLEKKEVSIKFGRLGAAKFKVAQSSSGGASQYSAKFVSVRLNKPDAKKPCVVLSGSLGLTRVGTYNGELDPLSISKDGVCQVKHWTEQK